MIASDSKDYTLPLAQGGRIPLLGFGTWQLLGNEAYEAVRAALDVGYRHIDTATNYGNEAEVGRALRQSGVARDDVFITTKLPPRQVGQERETLQRSLSALGIDAVDLWLIHAPPVEAGVRVWREFLALHERCLARAVGVSNYSPEQVDELIDATGVAPALNQIKWSPFLYDRARAEHSRDRGVVLEGYSPFRTATMDDPVLAEIADKYGRTPAQVILRWHLEHEVVVIPKSAQREHIEANFDVFGFALDADEIALIDALSVSGPA